MVGKICEKSIYRKEDLLGKGAFGEVYKLSDTLAVKEEIKVAIFTVITEVLTL